MRTAEKNMKRRSSYLPVSIGLVLKIAVAVAGVALWGWAFVVVVVGAKILWGIVKGVLSCLFSLALLIGLILLLTVLIF